ncbi:MAG: FCD domain-containing protein [Burkholderiales bacterium]|nr:MAG: FCD domain-containing protein [Burkholderiales bacterium]
MGVPDARHRERRRGGWHPVLRPLGARPLRRPRLPPGHRSRPRRAASVPSRRRGAVSPTAVFTKDPLGTHGQLAELDAAHDEAFRAGDDRHVQLGYEFHRFINKAADSPRLALLLGNLAKQLPNRFYASIEGQVSDTLQYHPIILDAMRVKDGDAVRSLMYRHIMHGAEHLIDSLVRAGTWVEDAQPIAESAPKSVAERSVKTTGTARAVRKAKS